MTLARMVATCEDDLICDMAETYHVMNWRELPLKLAATLASGLHPDSRIKRRLRGETVPMELWLQAAVLDQLQMLSWMYLSRHSKKKIRRPASILHALTGERKEQRTMMTGFNTPEEFELRRKQIIEGE